MDENRENKLHFRQTLRQPERQLPEAYCTSASRDIASRAVALTAFQQADVIFAYISMPGEPATEPLIREAWRRGKTVCVPRCYGRGEMKAFVIRSLADLQPGRMHIPEPVPGAPEMPPERISLALVPCVAADRRGNRMGHGAGYYDRFLAGRSMKKVCLCFERALADQIPTEETDIPMDCVVTENGIYENGREERHT